MRKLLGYLAICAAMIIALLPRLGAAQSAEPCPTSQGAAYRTGMYRNVFTERGLGTQSAVDTKVQGIYNQLFVSGDSSTQKLLYDTSDGMSYVLNSTTDTTPPTDIRTEGLSYGMMIAVQMNQQTTFNKLWNFAITHMLQKNGTTPLYFAWHVNGVSPYALINDSSGKPDTGPAPDGEEYFAMALIFADARWGSGTFSSTDTDYRNYKYWATQVVGMLQNNLFDASTKLPLFSPKTTNKYTDPSYNLPAFYELYAIFTGKTAATDFWRIAANNSRVLFANETSYGKGSFMMTDYEHFDGSPVSKTDSGVGNDNASNFAYDSWRVIQNIAMDDYWCVRDSIPSFEVWSQLHTFQDAGGVGKRQYGGIYTPSTSTWVNTTKNPGLIAMNAVGAIVMSGNNAENDALAKPFIEDLWNQSTPTGNYRYYDGLLHMLGYLNVSGKYRIYGVGSPTPTTAASMASGQSMDNAFANQQLAQPSLSIKNLTTQTLSNFKARYFFTTENGKTPIVSAVSTLNSTLSLEQIDAKSWAVVLNFAGKTLAPGQTIPANGSGETFSLQYSDNSTFDKSNDYSQPRSGTSFNTTDQIAVYNSAGNLVMGSVPHDTLPSYIATLKSSWGNVLTSTAVQNDADIKAQPLTGAWNTQSWQVEPIPATGYVRLKNTATGNYMNVQKDEEAARVVTYDLKSNWATTVNWGSAEWIVEPVSGSNEVRFKNVWTGRYLTVGDSGSYASIYAQALSPANWISQRWVIQ